MVYKPLMNSARCAPVPPFPFRPDFQACMANSLGESVATPSKQRNIKTRLVRVDQVA